MNPLATFNTLIDSPAWPTLQLGLHGLFFLAFLYLLKRLFDLRRAAVLKALPKPKSMVGGGLVLLVLGVAFGAVLAYQASWQLMGMTRPDFIAFMQTYDRRQFNPAHRIARGRIADRRGRVLADSDEAEGRVRRVYPYGPVFAHVIGYQDPTFGATGLEGSANAHLNGSTPADLRAWRDLGQQVITQREPRGQDLVLTLDADLQRLAFAALDGRAGAVVMLRPGDGAVRVLASAPAFDPNRLDPALFKPGDPNARLLNRALQGRYPPGSTFKLVVAAEALAAGQTGPLYCEAQGFTTSARYPLIRDHDYYTARRAGLTWKGHGSLGLSRALAESCNVFFAKLGVQLGHERFAATLNNFLFGQRIPLHSSAYGSLTMVTGEAPRIAKSDQYGLAQASIGQGRVLMSPAHLALITAAIANDGLAVKPRLVASDEPEALARLMTATQARQLQQMMRRVVTEGTARGIAMPGLAIAGKTGTAQNSDGAPHSWFVGFAPADRRAPEQTLAIAVLVEQGGYGSAVAAPLARDLLLQAQQLGLLP
ncbi:peptidoglycan D,D-transpeptidase FtsI family protein [Thiorhodovibrio frisius]|uniref:Cell division protein FtsI/penicillin-binding protein 2 n=1 Tax=Thiorhodovibrio frisius TaxID=631362 RepID=H8YZ00_9GAMM|nr:penicillin-binding transpeptidase domain-containing protein [Thiorhodovibrio frisius]EIC21927.1 cell division protein FtsI/penicillin-binding protein 2 [Thiorhodovibrio frisius]WPL24216.1 Penicillin-binding protein A [Thiorhodovibrio frisius]